MIVRVTMDKCISYLVKQYKYALLDERFLEQEKARLGLAIENAIPYLIKKYRLALKDSGAFLAQEFAHALEDKIAVKCDYPVCVLEGTADDLREASYGLSQGLMDQINNQL